MDRGGSSTFTYAEPGDAQRWKSRPVAAWILRALVRIGPIVLAFVVATFVGQAIGRADGASGLALWVGMVWAVSSATMIVTDRMLQQLLPLATLLRLSLVFPDEAPSRFKFALRTGTAKHLERRLEEGRLGNTAGEAAQTLLTMLTTLRDHDRLTRGHSERVRAYSMLIAERMDLTAPERDRLQWGALAHDVGKLAVAPEILGKRSRPTEAEWQELRRHPAAAEVLIEPLRPWLGEWADAATQHHERFDGRGYPAGLAGTDITMAGRIVAVADAFDTMTSVRSYKPALVLDDAMAELARSAGTQFDPEVVRAFLAVPLRRVRLVAGSFGWLGNLPFLGEASAASSAGGAGTAAIGAGSAVAATAAIMTGAVVPSLDFLGEASSDESAWTTSIDDVERRVGDEGPEAPSSDVPAEIVEPAPDPPVVPTTAPVGLLPPSTTGGAPPTTEAVTTTTADAAAGPTTTTTAATSTTTTEPTTTSTTTAPSSAPTALDDSFTLEEGEWGNWNVAANDSDPDGDLIPGTLSVVVPPVHAQTWHVRTGARIRYEAPDFPTTDSLVYEICDGEGQCDQATVFITVIDD